MAGKRIAASRVRQGARLFKSFRLEEIEQLTDVDIPDAPDVGVVVGMLDSVEYTTRRAGKVEHYRHEFAEKSRPLLVASADGKQLIVVGGRYKFTDRGIVDF